MSRFALLLAVLIAFGSAISTVAEARDHDVLFRPGKTSAHYSDRIEGYDHVNYYLDARAGQTLSITFKKNKSTCYFNLLAPTKGETVSMGQPTFNGVLTESGRYRAVVYLMRASACRGRVCDFSINFEIKD
ncbi:hypothetical protein [Rhizobium sp. LjRoot254]|uniref:hypothetical protein n=1 Tax=Rhizobium sp. LjRoot254 TaxID=3342297 RepID=UPI003ECE9B12